MTSSPSRKGLLQQQLRCKAVLRGRVSHILFAELRTYSAVPSHPKAVSTVLGPGSVLDDGRPIMDFFQFFLCRLKQQSSHHVESSSLSRKVQLSLKCVRFFTRKHNFKNRFKNGVKPAVKAVPLDALCKVFLYGKWKSCAR